MVGANDVRLVNRWMKVVMTQDWLHSSNHHSINPANTHKANTAHAKMATNFMAKLYAPLQCRWPCRFPPLATVPDS